MAAASIIQVVSSQLADDCGVSALSMYLGIPYAEVYAQARRLFPRWRTRQGMTPHRFERTAAALGTRLTFLKDFDPDDCYGILMTRGHACVLRDGQVIEADGSLTVWEYDEWRMTKRQRPVGIYQAID